LKNNHLNHFKTFRGQCDIFRFVEMKILQSFNPINLSSHKHYTYKFKIMQNQKSTENQKNQLKTFLLLI